MPRAKTSLWTLISHLGVFVIIEILFVFVILHEFPEVSLFETLGIVHISYWLLLIIAGVFREKLHKYWQKFLASYVPVVYHMLGHIYISIVTIESIETVHAHEHTHSLVRMIVATIALGILIFVGEWLLHRTMHCEHHHGSAHKHCKEVGEDNQE